MRFQMQEPAHLHRQCFSVAQLPKQLPTAIFQQPQRSFSRLLPPDEHWESNCEHTSSVEQECRLRPTSTDEISGGAPGFHGGEMSGKRAKSKALHAKLTWRRAALEGHSAEDQLAARQGERSGQRCRASVAQAVVLSVWQVVQGLLWDKSYAWERTGCFCSATEASAASMTLRPSSSCSSVTTSGTRMRMTLLKVPAVMVMRPCS